MECRTKCKNEKITKLLEENLGIKFHEIGLGNSFLDRTPKAHMHKTTGNN